jgi:glycosyltransferase involved in cell wall biosynthesis
VELVIVADGGDEPLDEWLAPMPDDRVRIVRTAHGGLPRARNAGVAAARGSLIRFVDADDILPPDSTAQLAALVTADSVIAHGATLVCDEALRPIGMKASALDGDVREACLCSRFDVTLPALLFPRRVIELTGDSDPARTNCEDWDFVLRALDFATVRGTRDVVYHYRRHAASTTATLPIATAEQAVREMYEAYFARHPEEAETPLRRRVEVAFLLDWAPAYAMAGDFGAAAWRLARAAALDPVAAARFTATELPRQVRALARRFVARRG